MQDLPLLERAECAKLLYKRNVISYEEYVKFFNEYSDFIFEKSKAISAKYGKKPSRPTIGYFDRLDLRGKYTEEYAVELLYPEIVKGQTPQKAVAEVRLTTKQKSQPLSDYAKKVVEEYKASKVKKTEPQVTLF